MRNSSSQYAALLIVVGIGAGCGSDSGPGPGPSDPVLTTLQVTPATATLFTVAPGNTATLAVSAKDQDSGTMVGLGSPSFSSDNAAIVNVSEAGAITALAAGTAQITASLTAAGVTKTGATTVTARVAPASGSVVAVGSEFSPATLDLQAGGVVRWTFGSTPHDVAFTTGGAPASVPQLHDGSASRTFPTNGSFNYLCRIHPGMRGSIHVH
jgi:plastocyanin